jgi:hypothetical protein
VSDDKEGASDGAFQGDLSSVAGIDLDLEEVFIARASTEAVLVSDMLASMGVDHYTALEPYLSMGPITLLFTTFEPIGIAFYVRAAQAAFCRARLTRQGLRLGAVP